MPHTAPPSKRAGVIEYGAKVVGCENAKRAEVCEEEMSKVSLASLSLGAIRQKKIERGLIKK